MFLPLPTPDEIAAWDRETIRTLGIPGMVLMENASREAVAVLLEDFGEVEGMDIHLFAGSGNNGGDAFAMARHLADLNADVTVFHTKPKSRYTGEARANLNLCGKLGIPMLHLGAVNIETLPQPDIIIDGLLGTGFQGELRQDYQRLVQGINRLGERAYVLAIDIPSGLNGLTGKPQPDAVRADATATFQAAKLGLIGSRAEEFTGDLFVCSIGIPRLVQDRFAPRRWMISDEIFRQLPPVEPDMHKGRAGHVLIVGGSQGLTGAPHLAALGALRAGAGLVTVACPGALAESIKAGAPEIMTLPIGSGTEWEKGDAARIASHLDRFDAAVVGPGLGRTRKTVDFLNELVAMCPLPLVLDADALFCLAQRPELLKSLSEKVVLTPHPGEMGMLTGRTSANVQDDRIGTAEEFTRNTAATLVLKGSCTVVADNQRTCISPVSAPALAVGGSGDVLAGLVGSLLARETAPFMAACLGVYWHATAGLLLEERYPSRGNLAREIATMLPEAAKE
ncbi:NAD(P)H-hydrate dehydratase [Salidesulfovibrio onnuriiensis]|uniref:NAD(P)H-hydrate dehydratase n=1 Tax=Salidesulfovibrio onnuriiensis TaxID=2583823 RepID=UPI00164F6110|nr:NAD(P)H-hydrate dehydratase [Salidesulfovibrio onnuriiensis]